MSGTKLRLTVFDRKGELYDEVHLPASKETANQTSCLQMAWDKRSEKLAVLVSGPKAVTGESVLIYRVRQREPQKLETQTMKELTHLAWDPPGHMLSVGTAKGNVLLYDSRINKTMTILGKHTKRITCGAWSAECRLALGGDDKQVTVSLPNGDTVTQLMIKGEPRELHFAPEAPGAGAHAKKMHQMSVNVAGKSLYLYRLGENDQPPTEQNPAELAFQDKYGKLMQHHWFGESYLLIGFETGYVVVLSTHNREMQEELHSSQLFTTGALEKMSYCREISRVAASCGPTVKIVDVANGQFNELLSDKLEFDNKCEVTCLGWALDGQVLTVATTEGHVYNFLASLPTMSCAFNQRLVYLTSLLEVSVADLSTNKVGAGLVEREGGGNEAGMRAAVASPAATADDFLFVLFYFRGAVDAALREKKKKKTQVPTRFFPRFLFFFLLYLFLFEHPTHHQRPTTAVNPRTSTAFHVKCT